MSLPTLLAAAAAGGGSGTVTLSGATISDTGPSPARATLILRTDGTTDKREGTSVSQINTSTDWIIPNAKAGSDYEFKWTVSGDAPTEVTGGWTSNTWVALTSDLTVGYATGAPGTESGTFTVSVRRGSGPTLDSAAYVISATEV